MFKLEMCKKLSLILNKVNLLLMDVSVYALIIQCNVRIHEIKNFIILLCEVVEIFFIIKRSEKQY